MNNERIIRIAAGTMVLISVALSHYHHTYWLFLTLFVGLNLLQSGFTQFCPLNNILKAVRK